MKIKRFGLGDVLSITTGVLISPRLMAGVYDILNFMTGDNLFTHQLPRASQECAPHLLQQFPQLNQIDAAGVNRDNCEEWLADQITRYGDEFDVAPLPTGAHRFVNPISELTEMVGNDRVIDLVMTRVRLSPRHRLALFEAHNGICHICGQPIRIGQRWEISHPIPIALGGPDDDTNRAPAHKHPCHSTVTASRDIPAIAKAVRNRTKHVGAYRSSKPLPCGRGSRLSKKITGEVVRRMTQGEKLAGTLARREVRG